MIRLSQGTYFGALRAQHDVGRLRITENGYAPGARIPRHTHAHPFVCLVVRGGFTERSGRQSAECGVGSVLWHPAGEAHEDDFGPRGGTCVGLEFDHSWLRDVRDPAVLPRRWTCARGGSPAWLASRIAYEARRVDDLSSLAVEGLTYALLAELARAQPGVAQRQPPWLNRGVDMLRNTFRSPPSIAALAGEAGVNRSHFVRRFHVHMGCTVAEYVRRLRIEWACSELRRPDGPLLSQLALDAGFADQPHFTRSFRRVTGMTPAAFRAEYAD
jgi:AraC family transcriptional regulator